MHLISKTEVWPVRVGPGSFIIFILKLLCKLGLPSIKLSEYIPTVNAGNSIWHKIEHPKASSLKKS